MKSGDLVMWTFAPLSSFLNKEKKFKYGILLKKYERPRGSWLVLLQTGERIHASAEEIELVKECK